MSSEPITEPDSGPTPQDMELENPQSDTNNGGQKRERDEEEGEEEQNSVVSKKLKNGDDDDVEKSVEEERMEERESGKENPDPVNLGPKRFESSLQMFDYFYKFLHHWPTNIKVNKYEYMVLLDLIKKGHPEPDKKISSGVKAFEIRHHPTWKSRCFFVLRADETIEDFSFRKCVDHILPLPENMKVKSEVNQALSGSGKKGGGGGRGGRGRGRGRGRGGKHRN